MARTCRHCQHPVNVKRDRDEDFDHDDDEARRRHDEAFERYDALLRCRCECHGAGVLDVSDWDVATVQHFVVVCQFRGVWGCLTPFDPRFDTPEEAERYRVELTTRIADERLEVRPTIGYALMRGGELLEGGRQEYGSPERAWAVIGLYHYFGYPPRDNVRRARRKART